MKIGTDMRNAAIDAALAELDSGDLLFFTGTVPANVSDANTGTLLGTLTFAADAFPAASVGVATIGAVGADVAADDTGVAGYAVGRESGGANRVHFTVGTSGADVNLNTLSFEAGGNVSITGGTITMPE